MKMYQANIALYPNDYRNVLRLGLLYFETDTMSAKAVETLKQASLLVDTIPVVWEKLGQAYGRLKKTDNELAAYEKLLSLQAMHPDANRRVGMIRFEKGMIAPAITNLEIALTMMPNDAEIMLFLADGYIKTGRPAQAIDLLTRAKGIRAKDVDIRTKLYALYKDAKDARKAESEMKGLIDLTGDNKYRLILARDLVDAGKYADANRLVSEVNATDPENIESLMLLALIQRAQNKYDEAIETYKAVSFAREKFAPAYFERGETYMLQAKYPRAVTCYERALELNPNHALAELGLARAARAQNDLDGYKSHLENARKLAPDNDTITAELRKAQQSGLQK
jgi:tetratricopeptide (TPR) repeat protein